ANSGTLVFPTSTTPARRTRSTMRSSVSGTWSAKIGDPYVVRHPATAWVSLTANGSPRSGPTGPPRARGPSAVPAPRWDRAASGEVVVGRPGSAVGPVGVEGDDRVELRVALLDPGQVQVEQLARGDPPGPDRLRHLPGGRLDGEVGHRRRDQRPAITPSSTSP